MPAIEEDCGSPFDDDCDGEVNEAPCACVPGVASPCYTGPAGTEGVGVCRSGLQVCNTDGMGFGPCVGDIPPSAEICAGPEDEDCDGAACAAPLWSKTFGDADQQGAYDLVVDSTGNVIVTGYLSGSADLGGGAISAEGESDIIVAKFDSSGSHLWSKQFGDLGDDAGAGVAVDAAGNVVVTGWFTGTVNFGGADLASAGSRDIFVATFDPAGKHLWSKRFGDGGQQLGDHVAVDAAGNILLTGRFEGGVDFGGGGLSTGGYYDVFVVKFDGAGNHVWSKRFGDSAAQFGNQIAADSAGNVVLLGLFLDTIDFGGGTLTSAGSYDLFLTKLDPSGEHLWSQRLGGSGDDEGRSLAMDGDDIVVAGYFNGSIDLGDGPFVSGSNYDMFVARFTPEGAFDWSRHFDAPGEQVVRAIAVDAFHDILLTGSFTSDVDFGGGALTSPVNRDIFLVKLNASGTHLWSRRFGSSGNNDYGRAVGADEDGNVYLTGDCWGSVDFGSGELPGGGTFDMFLAKFAP